jgi:hypothetical protein
MSALQFAYKGATVEREHAVYRADNGLTPWDMPCEVFWDVRPLASVRRALWAIQNVSDIDREEVYLSLGLHRAGDHTGWIPEVELVEMVLGDMYSKYIPKLFPDDEPK